MPAQRLRRRHGLPVCLLLVGTAAFTAGAVDRTAPKGPEPRAEQPDLDAGPEVLVPLDLAVAGEPVDPDCNVIGSNTVPITPRASAYRGNLYHIDKAVTLTEIQMLLAFAGTTDLYAAIHRKLPDETYVRYTADVRLAGSVGLGANTARFYSTSEADWGGVALEPGFEYAIGFAWGPTDVRFTRDGLTYPRPLPQDPDAGQTIVSLAKNSLGDPPVPPVFESLLEGSGAYNMKLCFAPQPGACCESSFPGSGCQGLLEDECDAAGGFFYGERSLCAETLCRFGACCDACGGCTPELVPEECTAVNGVAHWVGVPCQATLCPIITGACCNGTSCDDTKCSADCLAGGGTYRGDGTSCTPNMCQGACCIPSGCSNRTAANCAPPNQFKGLGTTCLTLSPENACGGACCRGFAIDELTECAVEPRRSLCAYDPINPGPVSAYRGDGTTCSPSFDCNTPEWGACCLPDGTCINTTTGFCGQSWIKGEFNGSLICEDADPQQNLCTPGLRRCCFTDGSCRLMTPTGCSAFGGQPNAAATTCSSTACDASIPRRACCKASGDCSLEKESDCLAQGGLYQADETSCGSNTCPGFGACCHDEDCLADLTEAQCLQIDGDYQDDGSTCSPSTGCEEQGACCARTGYCLQATALECEGIGGVFTAVGQACGANTCPSGACCLTESCEIRTEAGCVAEAGAYQADNVVCSTDLCATGACCNGETCSIKTENNCLQESGLFVGPDQPCADACVLGACCRDDCTCQADVRGYTCIDPGETFLGGGDCTGCAEGIAASDPPDCAIDALQPHEPEDVQNRQGWKEIILTLNCGSAGTTAADFTLSVHPSATPPTIEEVLVSQNMVTVTLDRAIDLQAWTCIRHDPSGDEVCLAALPGDADGSGTPDAADTVALACNLDGALPDAVACDGVPLAAAKWQCDTNRDGECLPSDILLAADILNGATLCDGCPACDKTCPSFAPWLDESLSESCPSVSRP